MKAKSKFGRILHRVLIAVAFACIGIALWSQREKLAEAIVGANWLLVGLAALAVFAYRPINAAIWSPVLASLGATLKPLQAARIWMVTEALRWVPGGIWGFASRVTEARRAGVNTATASLSLPVELALTILAWGGSAVLGLWLSGLLGKLLALAPAWVLSPLVVVAAGACGIAILVLAFRVPRFRNALKTVRPKPAAFALIAYLGLCVFHGLGFFLVLKAVAGADAPSFWAAVGANGAAWLVGFFAIGVPGGIGVREAGAAFFLAPVMGVPQAAAAAILWRALQIIGEVLWLSICSLLPNSDDPIPTRSDDSSPPIPDTC